MSVYYRPIKWALQALGGRVGGQFLDLFKARNPIHELDAATKEYVDARAAAGGALLDYVNKPYAYKNPAGGPPDWGWHSYMGCGSFATTHPMGRGYTYIMPLWVGAQIVTWDRIGIRVGAAGAGSVVRLGLYELDYTNNLMPVQLIADYGTVDTSSTTPREKVLTINLTTVNVFWLGVAMQAEGSATPPSLNAIGTTIHGGGLYGYAQPNWVVTTVAFGLKAQTQVGDGAFQTNLADLAVFENTTFPAGLLRRQAIP